LLADLRVEDTGRFKIFGWISSEDLSVTKKKRPRSGSVCLCAARLDFAHLSLHDLFFLSQTFANVWRYIARSIDMKLKTHEK
jgi:hypothetical protein